MYEKKPEQGDSCQLTTNLYVLLIVIHYVILLTMMIDSYTTLIVLTLLFISIFSSLIFLFRYLYNYTD